MDTIELLPAISEIQNLPKKVTSTSSRNTVDIRSINAKDISEEMMLELCEVVEDMWAWAWIKEFVKCNDCNKILSKSDIFHNIPESIYKKTVQKIMNITWQKNIICPCCSGSTTFMYRPKDYIDIMRDKYRNSIDAFLTIVRNTEWEIVWFSEWYVDTIDNLFSRRDLWDHYDKSWLPNIKKSIEEIIWYNPPFVFLISAIGLLESYVNPYTLINMLHTFTKDIPDKYNFTPWIMELEKWHILYVVSETLGAQKSWISYQRNWDASTNAYASDLLIFQNPIWAWKERFWWWMLRFLRNKKNQKPAIVTNKNSLVENDEIELKYIWIFTYL
jgi:hypothetical protein